MTSHNTKELEQNTRPDGSRKTKIPWRGVCEGAVAGLLIGFTCTLLGIYGLMRRDDLFLIPMLFGALIGLTPAKRLWLALAGLAILMVGILAYTPLAETLVRRWNRADVLPPNKTFPAVVVLSSHVQKGQTLDSRAQERILKGYELLGTGKAERLVVTESALVFGSQAPVVREQMRRYGLPYPMDSVGPVRDTHDEAMAIARLAHVKGWKQVLLVTHPWHMRRAAAVFQKAGVPVVCVPCVEGGYDLDALHETTARLAAFRDWLHEVVGYQVYRRRGWI